MGRAMLQLALCAAAALPLGCGGEPARRDGGADQGDGQPPDQQAADRAAPDGLRDGRADGPALPSNMGEGCISSGPCLPGSPDCLLVDRVSKRGICTRSCKQDDPDTPLLDEHDCPAGFTCSELPYGDEKYYFCLKRCRPSLAANPCPPSSGTTCHPVSTRFAGLAQTVCVFLACAADRDCPVRAAQPCLRDGDCGALGADAFCERESGRCARPGHCTPGGLCGEHALGDATAAVGDPCLGDFDCPGNGVCLAEEQRPDGSTLYRNGYCTIRFCSFAAELAQFACPTGSSCHHLFYGGLCHRNCSPTDAQTCRDHPADLAADYECYSWERLRIGDRPVTDKPVCQAARSQRCDGFGPSLNCTNLGAQGNPTHMRCREPRSGMSLGISDPRGICLDDTVSGAFEGKLDAGVDASRADAALDATNADAAPDAALDAAGDAAAQ